MEEMTASVFVNPTILFNRPNASIKIEVEQMGCKFSDSERTHSGKKIQELKFDIIKCQL